MTLLHSWTEPVNAIGPQLDLNPGSVTSSKSKEIARSPMRTSRVY